MVSKILRVASAAALAFVMIGASSQANATIYNIAANDGVGTVITLGAGTYSFAFVGTADGGAYDAANVRCSSGGCRDGWTNSFAVRDSDFATAFLPGGSTTVDLFSVGPIGSVYASAASSLAAYRGGPIDHYGIDINAGVSSLPYLLTSYPSSPFIVSSTSGDTYHFVVVDTDGGRSFNKGGVSFSITAVPEPASWALMILGFGGLGAALRRRRSQVALAA